MKYPQKQFNVLIDILKQLSVQFNIKDIEPTTLHFIIYQQLSDGQQHNQLYVNGKDIKRLWQISDTDKSKYVKLINNQYDFLLYPEGCNDSHIITAIRQALKHMGL